MYGKVRGREGQGDEGTDARAAVAPTGFPSSLFLSLTSYPCKVCVIIYRPTAHACAIHRTNVTRPAVGPQICSPLTVSPPLRPHVTKES